MKNLVPLSVSHPEISDQWFEEKNSKSPSEVSAGSGYRAHWIDELGHVWVTSVSNRTGRGSNCPVCAVKNRKPPANGVIRPRGVPPGQSLADLSPALAKEWGSRNSQSASEVSPQSNKKAWWQAACGHEWEARIQNRFLGSACPYCSNRKVLPGFNDLATHYPQTAQEWNYDLNAGIQPSQVSKTSSDSFWWTASCGHTWKATVANRTISKTGCHYCSGFRVLPGETDLATKNPELVGEWVDDIKSPKEVTSGSAYKASWRCSRGHIWTAPVVDRTYRHRGCPTCAGTLILPGFNDLKSTHPKLAEEWSPNNLIEPDAVSYGSSKRVLWVCSAGHTWESSVYGRTNHAQECPTCNSRFVSSEERELAEFISNALPEETDIRFSVRNLTGVSEVDIYIPSMNLAFEFNGVYFHSEMFKRKSYHAEKYRACEALGITLVQVWQDDWRNKRSIVERMLLNKLGVSKEIKISARSLSVVRVDSTKARQFLEANHLQGYAIGTHIGLVDKDSGTIYALITVVDRPPGGHYLVRYATAGSVRGGFSKLLKHAETMLGVSRWVTFADLSYSSGSLYRMSGFTEDKVLPPDYSYLVGSVRYHKFLYRKQRFESDESLKYLSGATEREMATENNLLRVWDAGKLRFVKEVAS